MTVKLSELRVRADFDAGAYKAGMDQKVAADAAGAASSARLAGSMGQSYVKISQSGSVLDRLSRTYVEGFAASEKFDRAIRTLGRGVESGAVPLARVDGILDGVYRKFGMTANAAQLASAGYTSLAQSVATLNAKLEAQGRLTQGQGGAQQLAAFVKANDARLNAGAGTTSATRGADIEAYGNALDDLRAKYSPLFAVERQYKQTVDEITRAHQVGALSQHEMSVAIGQAEASFKTQSQVIGLNNRVLMQHQHNAALSSYAMSNLAFQINDVATMAAMGMSPMKILASQAGQFYQILSMGEGGVRGSLGYLGGIVKGLLTPFRLLTGAAVGFAGTAYLASSSWSQAQRDIQNGLLGMGSVAGVTAGDINRISDAAVATGKITVGEARQMALGFASTGRIGAAMAEDLVKVSNRVGKVYGETTEEAGQRLAKAFADPKTGVDELNKRFMSFDASTKATIKSLTDQGRFLDAQKLLLNGVRDATAGAANQTTMWASAWDRLTSSASSYWAAAGAGISRGFGGGTLEEQLKSAQSVLETIRSSSLPMSDDFVKGAEDHVSALRAEIKRLELQAVTTANVLASNGLSDAIKRVLPDVTAIRAAKDNLEAIKREMANKNAAGGLPFDEQEAQSRALQVAEETLTSERLKVIFRKSSLDLAKQDAEFAMQGIAAKTAGQKAELAYHQTLERELQRGNVNAGVVAENARIQVLRGEHERVRDSIVQRNFASTQAVQLAQFELTLVGKTADEAARLRAEFQARQQVSARAIQEHRAVQPGELEDALRDADKLASYQSKLRADQFSLDNQFERSQLFRSKSEQDVYSRLNSAGLLANGQISSDAAEAEAAYIRVTIREREAIDAGREFGTSVIKDLVAGKSAADALANALSRVADRLLDSSLDGLFSGLFGGNGGSFGIPNSGGWSTTVTPAGGGGLSSLFAGIFHAGGVAGNDNAPQRSVPSALFASAPRYHTGGVAGYRPSLAADEIPAILQRGEVVLPKSYAAAKGSDSPVTVSATYNIDARGTDSGNVVNLERVLAEHKAGMKQMVIEAVRDARDRRLA